MEVSSSAVSECRLRCTSTCLLKALTGGCRGMIRFLVIAVGTAVLLDFAFGVDPTSISIVLAWPVGMPCGFSPNRTSREGPQERGWKWLKQLLSWKLGTQHLSQIRPQDISVGRRLHDHGTWLRRSQTSRVDAPVPMFLIGMRPPQSARHHLPTTSTTNDPGLTVR